MSEEKLKTRILEQINQEKPYPAWRFWLTDFLRIFTILILLLGAGLSLAYFIWDWLEIGHLNGSESNSYPNIWIMLGQGLPEILILVVFISILLYVLYRQTDLPFVKNRSLVLGSVWVILVILSAGLIIFVQNSEQFEQYFMETQTALERLPYRPNRFKNIYRETRLKNVFVGRVVQINKDIQNDKQNDKFSSNITIKNPFEIKTFVVPIMLTKDIKRGDMIKVTLSINENTPLDIEQDSAASNIPDAPNMDTIIEIQKLPNKPFDPLRPPVLSPISVPILPPNLSPNTDPLSISVTFFNHAV